MGKDKTRIFKKGVNIDPTEFDDDTETIREEKFKNKKQKKTSPFKKNNRYEEI